MSWDSLGRKAENGPFGFIIAVGLGLIGVSAVFGVISYGLGWFSEAGKVAQDQFGPAALLKKYEGFKDMSAHLDARLASIKIVEKKVAAMEADKANWTRPDKEAYYIKVDELAAMKASFNNLAAEYNSEMSKDNYAFANVGRLPAGAKDPLPREYKTYLDQ